MSCCQAPSSHPEALQQQVRTIRGDPKSPLWPDTFEFCRFYCRSHGRSTAHENAYIGARHHCFSRLGKPMVRKGGGGGFWGRCAVAVAFWGVGWVVGRWQEGSVHTGQQSDCAVLGGKAFHHCL